MRLKYFLSIIKHVSLMNVLIFIIIIYTIGSYYLTFKSMERIKQNRHKTSTQIKQILKKPMNKLLALNDLIKRINEIKIEPEDYSIYYPKKKQMKSSEDLLKHPKKIQLLQSPFKQCLNEGDKLFYLTYVFINVHNFERRHQIRNAWADKKKFPFQNTIFVLGLSDDNSFNFLIENENKKHGDILQGNFMDTFRNTSYKSVAAWSWISKNCSKTKFTIKLDEGVAINIYHLAPFLVNLNRNLKNLFVCHILSKIQVDRNEKSPYFTSFDEYKPSHYGRMCSGSAIIMTSDLTKKLYDTSFETNEIWYDDVYVSLIAAKLNSRYFDIKVKFVEQKSVNYVKHLGSFFYIFNIVFSRDYELAWNLINRQSYTELDIKY